MTVGGWKYFSSSLYVFFSSEFFHFCFQVSIVSVFVCHSALKQVCTDEEVPLSNPSLSQNFHLTKRRFSWNRHPSHNVFSRSLVVLHVVTCFVGVAFLAIFVKAKPTVEPLPPSSSAFLTFRATFRICGLLNRAVVRYLLPPSASISLLFSSATHFVTVNPFDLNFESDSE